MLYWSSWKGLVDTLLLKEVEQQFFRLILRFYCVTLPNNFFPEFFNIALLSFIIDFVWLELLMAPVSALSRLWYGMALLVCPTRSNVCWSKLSKSSMGKSASSSGAAVALSRACHTFDRGPMTWIFFGIFSSVWFFSIFSSVSKRHTDVWLFSFRRWDINLSSFFYFCSIRGNGFSVKIDSFKSRSCTYWLKWEVAYFAMSSGRTQLLALVVLI